MAGWISSKLKVAENLLQQIDQQAADSLRKNERSISPDLRDYDDEISKKGTPSFSSSASASDAVPLKLQIQKKPARSDRRLNLVPSPGAGKDAPSRAPETVGGGFTKSTVEFEEDWTELLSAAPRPARSGGAVLGRQRSARRLGAVERRSNVSVGDGSLRKVNSPQLDTSESGRGEVRRSLDKLVSKDGAGDSVRIIHDVNASIDVTGVRIGGGLASRIEGPVTTKSARASGEMDDDGSEVRKLDETYISSTTVGSSAPYESSSSARSDSESESGSSFDSENERESREEERKRRERMMAEKAAALAVEAIKERENVVAKLEGEKQSLEKILEERKKQQAEEASELQTTMMENMEAVELEKQRHNSTRMEALACLAALESTNAELAKSLAATQWNLETEVNRVVELRQQIELKKLAQEDLKRKMRKLQSSRSLKRAASKETEHEHGMLEAEYSFLCDKLLQMKEKANKLEDDIETTKKDMDQPSLVELELKGKLDQLTDRLIQKQTQIEALSAEKAMLLFKIESVSRYLDDGGFPSNNYDVAIDVGSSVAGIDVVAGSWDPSYRSSVTRFSRIRAAESHLLSFIRQMDALFSVGLLFLRRNPNARVWSVIYLLLLHIWVLYVFSSHSRPANAHGSGAVFSLENINKTGP